MWYLQPSDLLAVNRQLTGDPEVGDAGKGVDMLKLGRACARHQGQVELYPGIHERAAALLDSLLIDRPFSQQNAPTAVLAVYAFYKGNGYDLDIPDVEMLHYIDVARTPGAETLGSATLAVFLGRHAHREEPNSD